MSLDFEDILYRKGDGIARITINRPRVMNAFRPKTIEQDQPGMTARRRRSTLSYLDGFYKVINDPDRVERRMIRRCKSD